MKNILFFSVMALGSLSVLGSTLEIAGEKTITDANFDAELAEVTAITLTAEEARLTFDLDSDHSFAGTITGKGSAVKTGNGQLNLTSTTAYGYKLDLGWTVNGGALLPASMSGNWTWNSLGPLTVNAPGMFFVPATGYFTVSGLSGDGVITNAVEAKLAVSDQSTFAGKICGGIRLIVVGKLNLTGSESRYWGPSYIDGGTLGIAYPGMLNGGGGLPYNSYYNATTWWGCIFAFKSPSVIRFLNDAPLSTNKEFTFCNVNGDCVFDGGAYGGVTFTGSWRGYDASDSVATSWKMHSVVLTGSNTVACVVSNAISETRNGGTTYLTKRGSGIWRLANSSSRNNCGTVAVEDGILQFESIAETNEVCSLGLATRTAEKFTQYDWDESRRVDYAILLGTSTTTGTVEYVGSASKDIKTRKFAVSGHGRIRNAGTGALVLHDVKSVTAGDNYLHLDGDDANVNAIYDLSDGQGVMNVVKEGTGTWELKGNRTFTGGLDVRKGTLTLRSGIYRWYKFSARRHLLDNCGDYIQFTEFGLFDADGVRQNLNLEQLASAVKTADVPNMAPGTAAYCYWSSNGIVEHSSDRRLANLFDNSGSIMCAHRGWYFYMDESDPSTWFDFIMHVTNGAPAIASYDFTGGTGYRKGSSGYTGSRDISSWQIEGSADGVYWNKLSEQTGYTPPSTGGYWYTSNKAFDTGLHTGFALSATHDPAYAQGTVSYVRVAPGAVLNSESALTANGLVIDAATGGGTLKNVAFAATGTLRVENLTSSAATIPLAMTFEGVTGLSNLESWTVVVNGRTSAIKVKIVDGQITLNRSPFKWTVQ